MKQEETYCYKSELESKISRKKDLYFILWQGCKQLFLIKIDQYYIPNMNHYPIVYLKDVLSWKKKVIVTNCMKIRYSNYKKIIHLDYLPGYEESYIPPRKYF